MKNANEIYEGIVNREKEEKYSSMMKHQEKIITEAIRNGDRHGSRLFVFSDKEYFHGIQKEWFTEFYARAKKELEDAGYRISGICVCW